MWKGILRDCNSIVKTGKKKARTCENVSKSAYHFDILIIKLYGDTHDSEEGRGLLELCDGFYENEWEKKCNEKKG